MKRADLIKLSIVALCGIFVAACSNSGKGYSNTTGWKYNDKKSTGFVVKGEIKGKTPPNMVAVEGGTFTIGEKTEVVTAPRDNSRRRITVRSFYMDRYEISNMNWREYTHWMNLVFKSAAPELAKQALPDETVWREELAYNDPYIQFYFTHPTFDRYPVVGVSWEQAMDYCQWRTDRINELALTNAGYLRPADFQSLEGQDIQEISENFVFNTQKYLLNTTYQPEAGKKEYKDLFGNPTKVTMAEGLLFPDIRLPTEAEWEFAAYGIKVDKKEKKQGFVPETREYPWAGPQVRYSKKGKYRGVIMANFVRGRGDYMGTAGALNDKGVIPSEVGSYFPNDFGLYNMAGNVNEWVMDVYRTTSFDDISEYNSYRGNVYTAPIIAGEDDNGNDVFVVDSLGRIRQGVLKSGDKRSYKDGDSESRLLTDFIIDGDTTGLSALRLDVKIDPTDVLSPAVDDETRVYKGGSWKDRAYWISPSTRRYLNQKKRTSDIGFRCAMSMIGETEKPVSVKK